MHYLRITEPPGPCALFGVTKPPIPPSPCSWVPLHPWGGSGGITLDVAGAPHPVRDSDLGQDPPIPVTALAWLRGCGSTTQSWAGGAGLSLIPSSRLIPVSPAGISEESRVEAPAFTDAIRMYRQSREQYGTWDMLCGNETQVRPQPRPGVGTVCAGG